MKLHYYPETDSLYIELKNAPGAEAREIVEGLVADFDAKAMLSASTSITPPASSICQKSSEQGAAPFHQRLRIGVAWAKERSDVPTRSLVSAPA